MPNLDLDTSIKDLGLLIGLLTDGGNGNVSVNKDWFRHPVTELEGSPTRVQGLLSVLRSLFPVTLGTDRSTLDHNETWYSIYSGSASLPTGLCLVVPKAGSSSGVISLGIFSQVSVQKGDGQHARPFAALLVAGGAGSAVRFGWREV